MYLPTIGLEIHAELKTATKMFCGSVHERGEQKPNEAVCPVCVGHPGTLPTMNRRAVELMIMVGLAIKGTIANHTKFDRKNYFYPDLPKGYQISQYDAPIVSGGTLNGIRIKRIHLEEDAGRLGHEGGATLVDYNRASLPLMELVTEPDLTCSEDTVAFARELRRILRYLGASDAEMENGQMRVEANISVRKKNEDPLGTKVEVKNLNSFAAVAGAIAYELKRQEEAIEAGKKIIQETRGWDDVKRITVSQRSKEEAHDYRYFPEPDLPPLALHEAFDIEDIKRHLPELPQEKRERFVKEYGLSKEGADSLVDDRAWAEYFEEAVSELGEKVSGDKSKAQQLAFNYLTSDLRGILVDVGSDIKKTKITPENFADLVVLICDGKISSRSAKDMLVKMHEGGADPKELLANEGFAQVSDDAALEELAKKIIAEHPKAVEDVKKGKGGAIQFLVGKAMASLRGRGNPQKLQEIFNRIVL